MTLHLRGAANLREQVKNGNTSCFIASLQAQKARGKMASSGAEGEGGGGAPSREQVAAGSSGNISGDAEAGQPKPAATATAAAAHAAQQGSFSTAGGSAGAGSGSSAEKEQQQQQQGGITTAPGGASASVPNPPVADNGGSSGGDGRSAGPAALSQSARVVSSGSNPPTPSKPQQAATAANDDTGEEQPKQAFQKPQQLYFIQTPHDNDVLCGRGGGTNHHPGNKQYRKLVEDRKRDYVNSSKRGKPLLSRSIVEAVRTQDPPGRFLTKDDKTGLWYDIGDQKAREKTAQALREGAPDIRKEIGQPYVHAIVPGESLKAVLTERDLRHAETTVGHHSPPKMGGGGNNDDGNEDSSSDPSKTLASMKTDTVGKLKRPKSLGSGGGGKRVVSAPVVMGNNTTGSLGGSGGSMLPSHVPTQTAYFGSSRGGKRSTSVPQQIQHAGYPHHGHHFHGYPPHGYQHQHVQQYYSHQQQQYLQPQQQPFPATAAQQWVAAGTGTAPTGPSPTIMGTGVATATAGTASGLAVSDDVARRLLLSEWITGGKIDGQQLELQRKMEAEADAYRTAGLMGIDPDEITKRLEGGKDDILSIVESHRAKATDAAAKAATAGGGPSHFKKRKLNGDGTGNEKSETRKRIDEALRSMGAF